jgi:hypothetical protein
MAPLASLQQNCNALSSTNTSRTQMILVLRLGLELMRQMGGNPRAAGAQGMSQGNGPTMQIGRSLHIQLQFLGAGQELRRKGFVDFHVRHIGQRHIRRRQGVANRVHRSNAHNGGITARHGGTDNTTQRGPAVQLDRVFRSDNDGAGAIANARGVGGRDDAVFEKDGLEFRDFGQVGIGSGMLIGIKEGFPLFGGDGDGRHFRLKDPRGLRLSPETLRSQRKGVAFVPRNIVFLGQIFRRNAHGATRMNVRQSVPEGIGERQSRTERRPEATLVSSHRQGRLTHLFRAASHTDFRFVPLNGVYGLEDGFKPGTAQAIHRQRRTRVAQAAFERDVARQVGGVWPSGNDIAKVTGGHGTFHGGGIAGNAVPRRLCGRHTQRYGRHLFETAAERTKGGALRGDDIDGTTRHFWVVDEEIK